jgi:subtilisin-like proprotein convertase family protein
MGRKRSRTALVALLALALSATAAIATGGQAAAAKKKGSSGKARTFRNGQNSVIPDRLAGGTAFVGVLDSTIRVGKAMKGKVVGDVDVSIRATHPDLDDLDFYLIAPSGAKVFLTGNHDGVANAATSYGTGNPDCSGAMTTFSDETANFLSDATAATPIEPNQILSPWAATVQPEGFPLSVLDGGKARGTWTLRAEDFVNGDSGTLNCWKLRIKPRNPS